MTASMLYNIMHTHMAGSQRGGCAASTADTHQNGLAAMQTGTQRGHAQVGCQAAVDGWAAAAARPSTPHSMQHTCPGGQVLTWNVSECLPAS